MSILIPALVVGAAVVASQGARAQGRWRTTLAVVSAAMILTCALVADRTWVKAGFALVAALNLVLIYRLKYQQPRGA